MTSTDQQSDVTVRLLERTSNRPVYELQDWQRLTFTERWRRAGSGTGLFPQHEITPEVVELIAEENLAIWIRRRIDVADLDGGGSRRVEVVFTGPIGAAEFDSEEETWHFQFHDNLIYLNDRVVNTDGVASVDPGNITAIAYIRSLLNSELLSPTDGGRAIDIPATLYGASAGGNLLDLPVRWIGLAEAVESACVAGEVGIKAVLAGRTVRYSVEPVNVQVAGSGGEIGPVSRELTGSEINITFDYRGLRNRVYVLGQNTGASRTVRTRSGTAGGRLRETVKDARHLSTNTELDEHGDAVLAEMAEPEIEVSINNVERMMNIEPGMKITVQQNASRQQGSVDIGPLELLVLGRTFNLRPNQADEVGLIVGHEALTAGQLFRQVARRSEQAQYV